MTVFHSNSTAETENFACELAKKINGGTVVALYGGLGMGKTAFDMYKVESWEDLYSSGFFDYYDMGAVICTEWSENIENALPENTVRVRLEKGEKENERIITVEGA